MQYKCACRTIKITSPILNRSRYRQIVHSSTILMSEEQSLIETVLWINADTLTLKTSNTLSPVTADLTCHFTYVPGALKVQLMCTLWLAERMPRHRMVGLAWCHTLAVLNPAGAGLLRALPCMRVWCLCKVPEQGVVVHGVYSGYNSDGNNTHICWITWSPWARWARTLKTVNNISLQCYICITKVFSGQHLPGEFTSLNMTDQTNERYFGGDHLWQLLFIYWSLL